MPRFSVSASDVIKTYETYRSIVMLRPAGLPPDYKSNTFQYFDIKETLDQEYTAFIIIDNHLEISFISQSHEELSIISIQYFDSPGPIQFFANIPRSIISVMISSIETSLKDHGAIAIGSLETYSPKFYDHYPSAVIRVSEKRYPAMQFNNPKVFINNSDISLFSNNVQTKNANEIYNICDVHDYKEEECAAHSLNDDNDNDELGPFKVFTLSDSEMTKYQEELIKPRDPGIECRFNIHLDNSINLIFDNNPVLYVTCNQMTTYVSIREFAVFIDIDPTLCLRRLKSHEQDRVCDENEFPPMPYCWKIVVDHEHVLGIQYDYVHRMYEFYSITRSIPIYVKITEQVAQLAQVAIRESIMNAPWQALSESDIRWTRHATRAVADMCKHARLFVPLFTEYRRLLPWEYKVISWNVTVE
jgi:hypothetical protein